MLKQTIKILFFLFPRMLITDDGMKVRNNFANCIKGDEEIKLFHCL